MVDKLLIRPQAEQISIDLGWLLQNDQVSDERLCSYLLIETSAEIERLISRFLKSPAERMAALDHIIFQVLLRRRLYKNNISGKTWLYQLIIQECLARVSPGHSVRRAHLHQVIQTVDTHLAGGAHFNPFLNSLTEQQRLFTVLHFEHHLSAEEIALVLNLGLAPVQAGLEQARQLLMGHQRSCGDCATLHSTLKGMETALCKAFQSDHEPVETTQENISERAGLLLRRLAQEKSGRHRRQWASRVLEAGLAVLLLVTGNWVFTQGESIQSLFSEPTGVAVAQVVVVPATPQPEPASTPLPPVARTELDENTEKVLSLAFAGPPRWHSLWADVQVKTYLVENYSDGSASLPGLSLRKQIWLNLPGYSRTISGPSLGSPDRTYSIYRGRISGQDFVSGQAIERPASDLIPDADLRNLFLPDDIFTRGGHLTQMGSDKVAGRLAWVLDWRIDGRRVYRYWIDQDYGVVLRRLEFDNSKFEPVFSDFTVTKIYFDTSFSAAIYAPDRYKGDHFAIDFSGDPEIPDLKSGLLTWSNPRGQVPVTGTDPSTRYSLADSRLTFFNGPARWMQKPGAPAMMVLFPDQADLSHLPLGGKSILACERSPDGIRLAYNSPPQQDSGDTALMVTDLASIQSAVRALPDGITSGDFAFSPDGRRLAFFGCEKTSNFCGVLILEIASGKLTRTLPLTYADYITWSPDGRSVALVGNDDLSGQIAKLSSANLLISEVSALLHTWHFQVIDVASGNLTYKKPFNWFDLSAPPDSPTQGWDRPFKVAILGVKGCALPSGG